jgi:hypothetical protein
MLSGEGPAAAAASLLSLTSWNYKSENTYAGQFDDFTNFNFGAVMQAAGVPLDIAMRGGGAINVPDRLLAGNIAGATIAGLGALGLGPDASQRGDDDRWDQVQILAGWIYAKHCLE